MSQNKTISRQADEEGNGSGHLILTVVTIICLILIAVVSLLPFLWMISASLKDNTDVFQYPIKWIPNPLHWENYRAIWSEVPLLTFFKNTIILSVVITFLQLLTSSFAAYAFSKLHFPGRNALFLLYLGTIAIPWQAYMIPQYEMMAKIHLVNTLGSLILLQSFSAFGVFLMRQSYMGIPNELLEAARLDGLSEYGIWAKIMLPLVKPTLATLTIFTFVNTWNDYMGPLIYLNDTSKFTIQLGIRMFVQSYSADYNLLMAAALCSLIPILIIFILAQDYFIEGIATTGVKG